MVQIYARDRAVIYVKTHFPSPPIKEGWLSLLARKLETNNNLLFGFNDLRLPRKTHNSRVFLVYCGCPQPQNNAKSLK